RGIGIQPDILLCRAEKQLSPDIKAKIAHFCNVDADAVITGKDVECIYEVPLLYHDEGLDEKIVRQLNIWTRAPVLDDWRDLVNRMKNPPYTARIAIVGKYIDLKESYKSLNEALLHGAAAHCTRVVLDYVDSENVEKEGGEALIEGADGILIPGGFGERGVEGKIKAIRYARENKIPFLGICLGMQLATVEFARNVAGIEKAHSMEFDKNSPNPVIFLMREWFDYKSNRVIRRSESSDFGGTMRLGAYPCTLEPDSFALEAYDCQEIMERHRHRYEFNNAYRDALGKHGLRFTGLSPDKNLVEIIELADHPWFLGCQFHPEFKSRPMEPHPLFKAFVGKSLEEARRKRPESFQAECTC
ncbi:MAG: CTP synthase, partial [Desulfobacteraceae bacterium]|nr:CTP synthase [Desulfobacteraceae bacterium]